MLGSFDWFGSGYQYCTGITYFTGGTAAAAVAVAQQIRRSTIAAYVVAAEKLFKRPTAAKMEKEMTMKGPKCVIIVMSLLNSNTLINISIQFSPKVFMEIGLDGRSIGRTRIINYNSIARVSFAKKILYMCLTYA